MFGMLLRLVLIGVVVWMVFGLMRLLGPRRPRYKCATCRHCGRLDSDGVICRFGDRETFKNPTHISMCPDHQPRG